MECSSPVASSLACCPGRVSIPRWKRPTRKSSASAVTPCTTTCCRNCKRPCTGTIGAGCVRAARTATCRTTSPTRLRARCRPAVRCGGIWWAPSVRARSSRNTGSCWRSVSGRVSLPTVRRNAAPAMTTRTWTSTRCVRPRRWPCAALLRVIKAVWTATRVLPTSCPR